MKSQRKMDEDENQTERENNKYVSPLKSVKER